MAKRIVVFLLIVVLVALAGTYAWHRYREDRRFNGGEVIADDNGKVTGDDGTAPVLTRTRSETSESLSNNAQTLSQNAPQTVPQNAPAPAASTPPVAPRTAPLGDTLGANPPNREVFTGSGKFQVYRQGDLTWRLNTETGSTCVLFATLEQWRRPVVNRNACPNG